ncbi:VanZ-like protein [Paenibacillus sp. 32O-W]|uniref:VanZ family protein n=1 Tax=Paenibacillus sp. 32O-W TaxID=1695218 RepID=UPI00071FBACB|nr:VanZ family protein [Paenibacillus sp. 32O-W]ALS29429.1 VanZ-like protein [Paenibacillus sp. 32O-W]
MDIKIETYIEQIVSQLNCGEEEKREIIDEMRDHLYLLKNEFLEQGFPNDEATQRALERFGEQKQLTKGLQESLFPFYRVFRIGTWILFGLYSFIILFKLLFHRIIIRILESINGSTRNPYFITPLHSDGYFDLEVLKINSNIVPFKNTIEYVTGSARFNLDIIINNTLGNVLVFLPFGIFLPLLFKKCKSLSKVVVASVSISFSIEVLQLVLKIGQFDIDDVILNVMGSIIGFLLIKSIKSVANLPKRRVKSI